MASSQKNKPIYTLDLLVSNQKEREVSNSLYAPIIIKTLVYGFIGLILVGVITAIIKLVVK
jgi:hypothetical protein